MDIHPDGAHDAGMENLNLWLITGVFVAAGAVKGISGMGLPTLSIALLGLFMTPVNAAALMLLPSLLTNLAQCTGPHVRVLANRLWPLWLGLVLATLGSPWAAMGHSGSSARTALGAVLLGYGLWGLARPTLPHPGRWQRPLGALAGVLSGCLTAATGVFVMPLVPYLQSLKLEKAAFIQALGLSFMVATLALAARLGTAAWGGDTAVPLAGHAVALPAAFLGLWLGARLRQRLPALVFQRALYVVFLALGVLMLLRS
ncbi:MAG: sulfite exporter TauE/SafE family protein [Hydrogenophaga sp.]|jgi:uncharacterized protein|nr:sulfite exporter TauE/SafE family protein [Hydrogenophaga sp.]